jgi:hypothetical protein
LSQEEPIPYGYCQCGCGEKVRLAPVTSRQRRWVKGEPMRYVNAGHASRHLANQTRPSECSQDGCSRSVVARGLCNNHYQQWNKARDPERFREYQRRFNERHPGRTAAQARARYARNPEKHVEYSRRATIKREYGLTLEEYDVIIARGCAICGAKKTGRQSMALDHCHTTGKVRDALCSFCNRGLGCFKDDPVRLRAAVEYLEKHTA